MNGVKYKTIAECKAAMETLKTMGVAVPEWVQKQYDGFQKDEAAIIRQEIRDALDAGSLHGTKMSIIMQTIFKHYLYEVKSESTARIYLTTIDHPIRKFINNLVSEDLDSVYMFFKVEELDECLEKLNASQEFVNENLHKHRSMTAALKAYHQFLLTKQEMILKYCFDSRYNPFMADSIGIVGGKVIYADDEGGRLARERDEAAKRSHQK